MLKREHLEEPVGLRSRVIWGEELRYNESTMDYDITNDACVIKPP